MAKTGKTIITFIYGIGALIAFVLLALVLSQSHMVLFPNAIFVFIPAAVCLSYFVFWTGVWVIAIIKMAANMAK